jgi:hypothetical protein
MDVVALQWSAKFFRGIGRPCEASRTITTIVARSIWRSEREGWHISFRLKPIVAVDRGHGRPAEGGATVLAIDRRRPATDIEIRKSSASPLQRRMTPRQRSGETEAPDGIVKEKLGKGGEQGDAAAAFPFIGDPGRRGGDRGIGSISGADNWRGTGRRIHTGHVRHMGPSIPHRGPGATGIRPRPVTNRSRRNGVSSVYQAVGDYTNSILKPHAAEAVKRRGEISQTGVTYPTPGNQCWPEGVPFIFGNLGMQILQQAHQITLLYSNNHEVRHVRLNEAHPAQVTPSWYGNSVGHYEGDTLVIDTVGIKIGPLSMVDRYGTPHTEALHVVERYRLLDSEAAKAAEERGRKENQFTGNGDWGPDPATRARRFNSNSSSRTTACSRHPGRQR